MGLFGFGKKKTPPPKEIVVKRKGWDFYTYTYGEGRLAVIEFDDGHAREEVHEGFPHCKRIVFFLSPTSCLPTGIPTLEENKKLDKFEADLVYQLDNTDCRLAGKMSYGAMREFVFQVNDTEGFVLVTERWIKKQIGYKIEVLANEGWEFFDKKIRPDHVMWQQVTDRHTIGELVRAGSNPELEHIIEHMFAGPADQLELLKSQLLADGFTFVSSDEGSLMLSKPSKLKVMELSPLTQRLAGYCASIGVSYDGWGAMIRK